MEAVAKIKTPPGPKGNLLLFRPKFDLRNETHLFIKHMGEQYGGISAAKAGPFNFVFLSDPDHIEHMFLNRDIYVKINEGGNLKYLLGNGLLTSEGEFWLKQRRLIQPVFHKQRLQGFMQKITDCCNDMMAGWEKTGFENFNFYREMNQVTLDIVGRTLLSSNLKGDFGKINHALTAVMEAVNRRRGSMFRIPRWVPLPSQLKLNRNRKVLEDTVADIIEKRRKDTQHYDDLLSMLIEVEDADTGEKMSDKQLRDEALTIFLAGHETTANAMAFTFCLLAKHPKVKNRVQAELAAVFTGKELNYDLLGKLEYTTMVIKESMRLYPPAWVVVRESTREDVVGGYKVKFNDKIVASPYAIQRNKNYWPEPDKFDPERFSADKVKNISRFAYFPFGGGARLCIGNNFAMMEMQLILAQVCSRYDFTLPEDFKLEILPFITLRPKGDIPLIFSKISGNGPLMNDR